MTGALAFAAIGRSPAQLAADWLRGSRASAPPTWTGGPPWHEGRVVLTASGQGAIALLAKLWTLGPQDEVLVPSYNCGSEVSPLAATGARIAMYRVDAAARIDIDDLRRRVTGRTRLVCVTHYFGRLSELGELVAFCRGRGIRVLEDCALSMFSAGAGRSGDAAVFSLRKWLPTSDGGALWLPGSVEAPGDLRRQALGVTARGLASQIEAWLGRATGLGRPPRLGKVAALAHPAAMPTDLPASYYRFADTPPRGGSRFAAGLFSRTDAASIVSSRRENYAHLRQLLARTPGLSFLWDDEVLPPGLCPLGLPVLTSHKALWHRRLNAARIFVAPWWTGCHRNLDWSAFPEALTLKSQLLLLPVHQGLTARDMNEIARVIRSLAAGA